MGKRQEREKKNKVYEWMKEDYKKLIKLDIIGRAIKSDYSKVFFIDGLVFLFFYF